MTPHELVPHGWLILGVAFVLFLVAYVVDMFR